MGLPYLGLPYTPHNAIPRLLRIENQRTFETLGEQKHDNAIFTFYVNLYKIVAYYP